ncbi:hypothetical protein LIER_19377 [Lithospermum erythrorhizon]|uniref:Uncharacterized protein n=1 Tax=Lithospermum erythrorhizon TaxID=34254 RepID=A0AAV3QKL0_LITER
MSSEVGVKVIGSKIILRPSFGIRLARGANFEDFRGYMRREERGDEWITMKGSDVDRVEEVHVEISVVMSNILLIGNENTRIVMEFKDTIDLCFVPNMKMKELCIYIPIIDRCKFGSLPSVLFFRFEQKIKLVAEISVGGNVGWFGGMILCNG